MTFRALLYTDCRAEESLRGGTGYQFQAASSDARATDEVVLLQELMYRPSPDLMAREAPVEHYPPSFAFCRTADGYAMAAGIYLGRVSGDGRQGNQITHGLFSDDAQDFAGTRPAQLFGADFWVYEKQPSKEIDSVDAPLLYDDEFDLPALHQRANVGAEPEPFLAKLISAFDRAAGDSFVKVIVSCSDPTIGMQWIALGTLLLPTEQALSLSIRAFVSDPASAMQRIVGVHPPSFNKPPDVTAIPGISGIDLDAHITSPIEVTDHAAYWAQRFLKGDPYEVVDAIELAGRLRGSVTGNRLVASVVILHEPLRTSADLDVLAEVIETFDAEEYDELAGQLVEAMRESAHYVGASPGSFLRILPVVQRFDGQTSELLDRLQASLLVRASHSTEFAAQLIADGSWRWAWQVSPKVGSEEAHAVAAALGRLDAQSLPAAFGFAARVGVALDPAEFHDAMQRLAGQWITSPELSDKRQEWLYGDRVLDLMVEELQQRVTRALPSDVDAAMASGRWDWLLDIDWVVRGGGPLASEIVSRRLPTADPRRQEQLIQLIATSSGPGSWRPLWRHRTPRLAEVMMWLDAQPADLRDPEFVVPAGSAIGEAIDAGRVRGRSLRLIDDLYAVAPERLPGNVARIGKQNLEVSRSLQFIRQRRAESDIGRVLGEVDPNILRIRMSEVVETLVVDGGFDRLLQFLQNASIDPTEELISMLDNSSSRFPTETLEIAFALSRNKLPKSLMKRIEAFPLSWYENAADETRREVGNELRHKWAEWEETELRYERKNESAVRKVGRLFGGRDKSSN